MRVIVTILTLLMALGLASIVAYVSVTGLMKLFVGAGMIGMIFFILIELSKIVSTTLLHTFKGKIRGLLRIGLNVGIGIAMVITSLGIYGFLSSTYKESFLKSENTQAEIVLLEKKRDGYKEQLDFIVDEKTTVNETIGELSKGLANNVIEYKDPETGEIIRTTSSSTRRALEKQLNSAIERQGELNAKADSLNIIVFDIENEILEVKLSDDTASELGPLIFLSDVTGMTMDQVMKWFILLLIIIGDPLAVVMVIAFNKIVNKKERKVVEVSVPEGREFNVEYPLPVMEEEKEEIEEVVIEPKLKGNLAYDKPVKKKRKDDDINYFQEEKWFSDNVSTVEDEKEIIEELPVVEDEVIVEDIVEEELPVVEDEIVVVENIEEELPIVEDEIVIEDIEKIIVTPEKVEELPVVEDVVEEPPVIEDESKEENKKPKVDNKVAHNRQPKKKAGVRRIK